MELTEKEKKFIVRYRKLSKNYIALFVFLFAFILLQCYLFIFRILPFYANFFMRTPETLELVRIGLFETFGSSLMWFGITMGALIGEVYVYIKIRRIIDKLTGKDI